MTISLRKCDYSDCEKIRQMQKSAFAALLEKYRDYDTGYPRRRQNENTAD